MRRMLPTATALALALAGCGKPPDGMPPETMQLVQARAQLQTAQADLAQARTEKDALAGELTKAKQELAMAKVAASAPADVAKLQAERDVLAADVTRLKKDLEATLASSRGAEPPRAADTKGREEAAAEAARARAAADDLAKTVDDLRRKERDLLDKLAASVAEAERARTAAGTLEKQALDAQGRADAAAGALRERLIYDGRETLDSHRVLPLAWNAGPGETIRWSWAVEAGPPDLAVDALEFMLVAPDGTKAYGARAGSGKTADAGSLAVSAAGRWTAVWQNRHPAEPFSVRFTVSLDAASAPRPAGGK
jgi:hypothetical protein